MSDQPLPELLAAVRRGDQAAADVLFQRHEEMLLRDLKVSRRAPILQNEMETRDLIQSVFLRAWKAIRDGTDFATEEAFAAYLREVGRNRLQDHVRRVKTIKRDRERTIAGEGAGLADVADKGTPPDQAVEAREEAARIEEQMSPSEMQLLGDHLDGAAWEELGKKYDRTPESLRKRLERVRKRVREALEDGSEE